MLSLGAILLTVSELHHWYGKYGKGFMESVGEKGMLAGFLHAIGVALNLHVKGHGNFIDLIILKNL